MQPAASSRVIPFPHPTFTLVSTFLTLLPVLQSASAGGFLNIFIILAVVALVAALLGFRGVAGMSANFAKIALVVAAILVVLAFVL